MEERKLTAFSQIYQTLIFFCEEDGHLLGSFSSVATTARSTTGLRAKSESPGRRVSPHMAGGDGTVYVLTQTVRNPIKDTRVS